MRRRGKKYKEAIKKYDKFLKYPLDKAVDIVKQVAYVKFDETIELSVWLNLKKSVSVRDTMVLPHQFGAEKRVLVFAKGDKAKEAEEAGAAFVGDADLIEKIKGGWTDFDVAVATPDMMKDVGKLGQVLGRKGLMPNPKTQTVTMDIKGALKELKKGRVEFRSDKTNVVHIPVGKRSMDNVKVKENVQAIIHEINRKRPSDTKGEFIKSLTLSSAMGPGVKLEIVL